jgi:hypothetical protein
VRVDRVVVVGAPAQQRDPRLDAHESGQRVGGAAHVSNQRDPVADDDGLAAELARPHGDDDAIAYLAGESAAVNGDHESLDRV